LPELGKADRAACHHDAISVLAALHSVDVDAAGLSDFGKPGNYFARQIARWSQQYRASETGTLDAMESLMEWLPGAIPPGADQSCLIHGDFNFENLMFHKHQPRVLAVLDWELSTLGHPLSDLAYYCMRLRLPRGKGIRGIGDMDRKELGIPGEEELVAAYCELRGIDSIDHWPFYLAFSFFRLAAIAQGVYKRALDGNASSERAIEVGKFARPLAEMGAALMD
jgi:aminoglycoside phosphotransferase (APT) family kinase protein